MNCLIWILLLCCCGSNGCSPAQNGCGCGCQGNVIQPRRTRDASCPCEAEQVEEVCFQVKRDTCDLPPFPTLSRGETCGCESPD